MKSLKTDVKINDSIARVCLTQVYHNPTKNALETEYFFPINDLGIFDDFTAIYKERVVNGVIKKKDVAKKEYQEGIKEGHLMGYAEIKEETPDIMKVQLGNLPAGESVTIKLSYL